MSKRTKSVVLSKEGIDKLANEYVDKLMPILSEFRNMMLKYNQEILIHTDRDGTFVIQTFDLPTKRTKCPLKGVSNPTSTKP